MFKRMTLALGLTVAVLLAGCSSGVKLDNVPVEDKNAISSAPGGGAASPGQSSVAPTDLGAGARAGADAAGPQGVARLVYFDYDSFSIKPEFQALLEAHARFIKAAPPDRKLMLEGHTDERGGREYNLALGQKRAEAVRRALALLGVPDSQMEAISFGKEKPAVQGRGEAVYAQNRRTELVYR